MLTYDQFIDLCDQLGVYNDQTLNKMSFCAYDLNGDGFICEIDLTAYQETQSTHEVAEDLNLIRAALL